MKHLRQTFLLCLLWMIGTNFCVYAQWTKPILPTGVTMEFSDVNNPTIYYLYNAEADVFYYEGNAWNTQATWTTEGPALKVFFTKYQTTNAETGELDEWDGKTILLNIFSEYKNKWGNAFIDNETYMFHDRNNQTNYFWECEHVGTDYRFFGGNLNPIYNHMNYPNCYMGVDKSMNTTIIYPLLDISEADIEGQVCVNWTLIPAEGTYFDELKVYNAAIALGTFIESVKADYPELADEIAEAEAMYKNTGSTIEELNAAKDILTMAVNCASLNGATEDYPKNATFFIKNADFSDKTIDGWSNTIQDATVLGYQRNTFTNNDVEPPVTISGFFQAWDASGNGLRNGEIYQTLSSLPAGKYKFTVDACAVQEGTDNVVTGTELFALGDEVEVSQSISTGEYGVYKPHHYEVTFVSTGGDITLGVRTRYTNANWIAADNFTLTYYGQEAQCETVYRLDMSGVKRGEFPPGWIADDNGIIHQYILNDDGSVGNYDWGGNLGGGGARVFTGFTGSDFTKAIYWRSLSGNGHATLTYGEQVNDFELSDGMYDPEMPENIQLYLEPGKYQISFLMAAWKFEGEVEGSYPMFDFMLQDVKGNETFTRVSNIEARPCTRGSYILDEPPTQTVADFTISTPGYYMLKFEAHGYKELLMAKCKVLKIDNEESTLDENIITFADANVRTICVANWDTNRDGKLSKEEAAAITDIGGVFKDNALITTFNELEYFTGVKAIPEDAFRLCSELREITIPINVENIGNGAFSSCARLKDITVGWNIPIDVSKDLLYFGTRQTLHVPSGLVEKYELQSNWYKFAKITDGGKTIENHFVVDGIWYDITSYVSGFVEVTFEDFDNSTHYTGDIAIPSEVNYAGRTYSVKRIGNSAFTNWYNHIIYASKGLKTVSIPNSITSIGDAAFYQCEGLVDVNIPNSVITIESRGFYGCSGLTSLRIPSSVQNIGYWGFGCANLKSIYVEWDKPLTINDNVFADAYTNVDLSNVTLYVPAGTKSLYENADVWKEFGRIVMPELYASSVSSVNGQQVTLPIYLNNENDVCNFQFDIKVPDGITIAQKGTRIKTFDITLGESRFEGLDHSITSALQEDGSVRVLVSSTQNTSIWNKDREGHDIRNSEPIVNVALDVASNLAAGNYSLLIKDIVLTSYVDGNTELMYPSDCSTELSVLSIYNVTASSIDSRQGTVSIASDSYDANTGTANANESITVTATPNTGYVFWKWQENGHDVSTENPYTFTLTSDRNLVAQFVMLGDVLEDGQVNVGDLTETAGYILRSETPDGGTMLAADVYKDGVINVGDFTSIAGIILNGYSSSAKSRGAEGARREIVNLQFDLELPSDIDLTPEQVASAFRQTSMGMNHGIMASALSDGRIRVLVVSSINAAVSKAEEALTNITIPSDMYHGTYGITLKNIVFAFSDYSVKNIAEMSSTLSFTAPTDINGIAGTSVTDSQIYDINGRKQNKVVSGVNIINGKKIYKKR